ncbi:HipA domain-containing protein [Marinimicrobium sp. ARAG 43.8]|uniref:HipA domain-containing protein n=1 Tax=Marinimicrobium sp. ARAG 43.8 TaxID=3418719 RepID=UPI003CF910EA
MMNEYCHISLKPLTGKETHPGYRDAEYKRLFGSLKMKPVLPFTRAEFFQAGGRYTKGMSISGVQEKLPLGVRAGELVPVDEGGLYILKPSPEAYPHAAENEHAGMELSRLVGIETALCGLIPFKGGEFAYVCRRFDRDAKGNKAPQEDLLQAAGLPSEDKYRLSYEAAGHIISKATNGKPAPVLEMIKRVMLAYVMGNDDLHLKNLSLRRATPKAFYSYYDLLTPNYDVLFCGGFEHSAQDSFLALDLLANDDFTESYERLGFYTLKDFLELGRRLKIPERAINNFASKLVSLEDKAVTLIQNSFMPKAMRERAEVVVRERLNVMSPG